METETAKPTETNESQPQGCQCQAQIGEILARLEKLEREALTLAKLEPAKVSKLVLDHLLGD